MKLRLSYLCICTCIFKHMYYPYTKYNIYFKIKTVLKSMLITLSNYSISSIHLYAHIHIHICQNNTLSIV